MPAPYQSYPPSLWGGGGDPTKLIITVPTPTAMVVGVPTTIRTGLKNDSDTNWGNITNTGLWTSPDGPLAPSDMTYETKDLGGTDFHTVNLQSDGNGGLTVTGTYPIPPNLDAGSDVRVTINRAGITVINGSSTIRKNGRVLTSTDYVYNVGVGQPADPQLVSIDPVSMGIAGGPQGLACIGSDFTAQSAIEIDGAIEITVFESATRISCAYVPTVEGAHPVVVRTGSHATSSRALTVTAATLEVPDGPDEGSESPTEPVEEA